MLSRESIVDATLKLIAAEGPGSVGMRSVARDLGVNPKSLYNHVRDKEDLLDAVAERLLGSIALPQRSGDLARDLKAIAEAFRDRALLNPKAAVLVLTRQLNSLQGLAPVEAILEVLKAAGIPTEESVHLVRMMVATVVGTLLREVSAGPTFGSSNPEQIASRELALRESGLPAVAEAASYLARFDGDAEFEFTIQIATAIIAGQQSVDSEIS